MFIDVPMTSSTREAGHRYWDAEGLEGLEALVHRAGDKKERVWISREQVWGRRDRVLIFLMVDEDGWKN